MSAYEFVQKGALKLKGVSEGGIKKKKKKSKSKRKEEENPSEKDHKEKVEQEDMNAEGTSGQKNFYESKTKSEIAFLKRKEERDVERIRKKASVSHKERVEKFNEYLNSLSEHYEPAKVSWTK